MNEDDAHNRMATPRTRGRPSKTDATSAAKEDALPVVLAGKHVPPLNCPCCGRGMVPQVHRWVEKVAKCTCKLCGKRFDYTPPSVRPLSDR